MQNPQSVRRKRKQALNTRRTRTVKETQFVRTARPNSPQLEQNSEKLEQTEIAGHNKLKSNCNGNWFSVQLTSIHFFWNSFTRVHTRWRARPRAFLDAHYWGRVRVYIVALRNGLVVYRISVLCKDLYCIIIISLSQKGNLKIHILQCT